jgi:hypothetical protein
LKAKWQVEDEILWGQDAENLRIGLTLNSKCS